MYTAHDNEALTHDTQHSSRLMVFRSILDIPNVLQNGDKVGQFSVLIAKRSEGQEILEAGSILAVIGRDDGGLLFSLEETGDRVAEAWNKSRRKTEDGRMMIRNRILNSKLKNTTHLPIENDNENDPTPPRPKNNQQQHTNSPS